MAKKKAKAPTSAGRPAGPVTVKKEKAVVVEGKNLPTYYVNHVHIDLTSWDVRFRLGQIQGVEDGALQVKELAAVYMAHGHAKAFLEALRSSLAKLENFPPVSVVDEQTH